MQPRSLRYFVSNRAIKVVTSRRVSIFKYRFAIVSTHERVFQPSHTSMPHTNDATRVDLASYEACREKK